MHYKSKIKSFKSSNNDIYLSSAVFGFLLGLLLFIFFAPNYYEKTEPIDFDIKEGSTLTSVIDSLYSKGIIPNKSFMHAASFLFNVEKKIKAGRYKIVNGLSYFSILELLLNGVPAKQKKITVPEGIWQFNLAGLVKKELNLDSTKILKLSNDKAFLKKLGVPGNTLEGYLLAETYYMYEDSDEEEVLRKLKYEMDKIFEPDSIKMKMMEMGFNKHEIITLASIIEGESNIIKEFKKISGVYHNRLKKGMRLQADPTVQYLKRQSKRRNRILYKDLEIDSPYNTYRYSGLPPGPINNPGKDAVIAALYPEDNNYYYFVADGTGGHNFARNISQHLKNVRSYRRWRRSQK